MVYIWLSPNVVGGGDKCWTRDNPAAVPEAKMYP